MVFFHLIKCTIFFNVPIYPINIGNSYKLKIQSKDLIVGIY